MSSILKVDTIQDQNGNLIISKDSGGSGFLSPYASSSAAITYTVTVASKTSAHPYNGVGSSNGYFINGIESPIIEIKGNDTSKPYHYKFDQSDSSNSGHPLLFYNNVGKTTQFTTGVTTNGTPGSSGAYTMIAVDSQTPNILYYQCSSHANMGNHTLATSPVVNTGVFLTLPTADGSSGEFVTTNGSGVLSFASATPADGSISTAKIADDAISQAKIADDAVGADQLAASAVVTASIVDDNVTQAKIADDAVGADQLAASAVVTASIVDANVTSAKIANDAITLAKMASGTDGNLISYDTSGNPVAVATGSSGQILTSAGAGAVPSFQAAPGGGKVLQVLQTVKLDTFSTTSTFPNFVDVTGMSQAITPSASNSKVLVTVCGHTTNENADKNGFRLVRGSTVIFVGNSRGNTTRVSIGVQQTDSGHVANFSVTFLDSPSTTNAVTYKLQASEEGGTLFFGGTSQSGDVHDLSAPASITLMEIGA